MHDLADSASKRHGPLLAARRSPVHRDDRTRDEIGTMAHIVVHERLHDSVAVGMREATATDRPDVVDQNAVDPWAPGSKMEHDKSRPHAPVIVPQQVVAMCWGLYCRTRTPD